MMKVVRHVGMSILKKLTLQVKISISSEESSLTLSTLQLQAKAEMISL
jgi:hypothetical protein